MPTRPRSTELPVDGRGAAAPASTSPQPASAPVRPTARTPAAVSAATSRVLIVPGQHRDDDVQRRLVGDAQPVDLPLLDAGGLERRVDLLAAAVHDDERAPPSLTAIARDRGDDGSRAVAGSSSSSPPNFSDERLRSSQQPGRLVERRA